MTSGCSTVSPSTMSSSSILFSSTLMVSSSFSFFPFLRLTVPNLAFHPLTLLLARPICPSLFFFALCFRSSSASFSLNAASAAEPLMSSSVRPAAARAFRRSRSLARFCLRCFFRLLRAYLRKSTSAIRRRDEMWTLT